MDIRPTPDSRALAAGAADLAANPIPEERRVIDVFARPRSEGAYLPIGYEADLIAAGRGHLLPRTPVCRHCGGPVPVSGSCRDCTDEHFSDL